MTGLESEVRENRRANVRLESYRRSPAPDQTTTLTVPQAVVEVDVTATLYTRPLNDTLIGGHPDLANGGARGRAGDHRGAWSQVAQVSSGEFVEDGRAALAEALSGVARGIGAAEAGSGTDTATVGDTDPQSGAGTVHAWHDQTATAALTGVAEFRFSEFGDVVEEVALNAENGDLLARLTTGGVGPATDEELKLEIELSYADASFTDSVAITDFGAIGDALATADDTVGLAKIALGTDGTDPTASDTSLGNEVVRKAVDHDVGTDTVTPFTIIFRGEPSTQPHDIAELAVYDSTGTMAWRATFAAEEKDDRIQLRPRAPLRTR